MLGMRPGRLTGRARKSIPMSTKATDGQQAASGGATNEQGPPASSPGRRPPRILIYGMIAAVVTIAVVAGAFVIARHQDTAGPRPSGIPANVPTSLANEMLLTPLPRQQAPGFTLTDQAGRTMGLSALRGKVVVLEFMDPHCTDICPIVSQEFVDAYHKLGGKAGKVVFAAINVNQYYATVASMATYSSAQRLNTIPGWHFFTGPVPALQTAWRNYNIEVSAPNPNADIIHTSSVYFIDPQGRERFLGSPMVDYTANGTAYLPLAQISDWADGIARLATDLTH
jgi:cytochrome oxidase Cu insertion factor (SCO1/SenC/PrrC family)